MAIDTRRRDKTNTRSRLQDKKIPYVAVLLLIIVYGIVTLGLGIAHLAFY